MLGTEWQACYPHIKEIEARHSWTNDYPGLWDPVSEKEVAASGLACLPELEEKGCNSVVFTSGVTLMKESTAKVILKVTESGQCIGLSADYWNEAVSKDENK